MSKRSFCIITALILLLSAWFYMSFIRYDTFGLRIKVPFIYNNVKIAIQNGEHNGVHVYASDRMKSELAKVSSGKRYSKLDDIERLIVYNFGGGMGDLFTAKRVQAAALKLGWEVIIIDIDEKSVGGYKSRRRFGLDIVDFIQPDYVISHHAVKTVKDIPNYLILHFPNASKFERIEDLLKQYDGLLLAYDSPLVKQNSKIRNFYLSVSQEDSAFKQTALNKIFFSGLLWDARRGGAEFKYLYKKLDEDGIVSYYGPEDVWGSYNSYEGYLPNDVDVFLQAMRDSGIALVAHSAHHFDASVPSSRIFEAAASSSIIISDGIQFVRDHFGNSALYFDPTASGEEMYNQIRDHYNWIIEHPTEASQMAKRSNEIINEKFTLEKQLHNVEELFLNIAGK